MRKLSRRNKQQEDEAVKSQIIKSRKPQIPKEDSLDIYEILILIAERLDAIEEKITEIKNAVLNK